MQSFLAVAPLALEAAQLGGFDDADELRVAALLHDVGRPRGSRAAAPVIEAARRLPDPGATAREDQQP
jgi:HD superfamily phosphodiesterase